jgi:hypothetical protein
MTGELASTVAPDVQSRSFLLLNQNSVNIVFRSANTEGVRPGTKGGELGMAVPIDAIRTQ